MVSLIKFYNVSNICNPALRKDGTKERWKNGCKVGWNQGRMEPGTKEDWSLGRMESSKHGTKEEWNQERNGIK